MNSEAIIRTKCYLCDGPIEFPAELTNQIIPCPHCRKEIKLFGLTKAVPRWHGLSAMLGTPWNVKQKIVAALFVLAVVVSLFNAPWEIRYRSGLDSKFEQVDTVTGSVFESRPHSSYPYVTDHRLMILPMLFLWAGFLAISGVLLWVLKTRDRPMLSDRARRRIITTLLSVLVLSAAIGVIGVLVVVFHQRHVQQVKAECLPKLKIVDWTAGVSTVPYILNGFTFDEVTGELQNGSARSVTTVTACLTVKYLTGSEEHVAGRFTLFLRIAPGETQSFTHKFLEDSKTSWPVTNGGM